MAKISDLPEVAAPAGTETVLVLKDGQAKRVGLAPLVQAGAGPILSQAAGYRDEAGVQADRANAAVGGALSALSIFLMAPETGYLLAFRDPVTERAVAWISTAGTFEFASINFPDAAVTREKLASEVTGLLPMPMAPETGFVWGFRDPVTEQTAFAITTDGRIVGGFEVSLPNMTSGLQRQLMLRDRLPAQGLPSSVRSRAFETGLRTSNAGYAWVPLPPELTTLVTGQNQHDAAFRRRSLTPIADQYMGTWSPGAYASNGPYLGYFDHDDVLPAIVPAAGSYFIFRRQGGGARDLGSTVGIVYEGDAIVSDGAAWRAQHCPSAPAPYTDTAAAQASTFRTWWAVIAPGTFNGVAYAAGDVILGHGGTYYKEFTRGDAGAGQWFNAGEWSAASGAFPAGAQDGYCYQVTAAGTVGGITFAIDDWAFRYNGAWGKCAGEAIIAVPANQPYALPCRTDASEWEARLLNKSTSTVFFSQKVMARWDAPTPYTTGVVLYSDSMGGYLEASMDAALGRRPFYLADTGLNLSQDNANHSAGAMEIVSLAERDFLTGDQWAGHTVLGWLGQNGEWWQETMRAHQIMRRLCNAHGVPYVPISVLGRRTATWNGQRLVHYWQEDQFNNVLGGAGDSLVRTNRALNVMFGGRYIYSLKAVLDGVTSTLADPTHPGMTELQVARQLGVVPLSYYFPYGTVPWSPNDLVYRDTWNATALPTGGANLDYYIRIGDAGANNVEGGQRYVGNIIVNVAGVWTEYPTGGSNRVHLEATGNQGNPDLANSTVNSLNLWGY
jgi:hypothetical protein